MFRHNSSPLNNDQFDTTRIQQQLATINFLAETLKLSTDKQSIHLHLAVLLKAIKKFEATRFVDYALNNTKHASKVLKKLDMYNALYKDVLKDSNSYFIAKALKTSLTTYSHSVHSSIAAVQNDLKARLVKNHQADMNKQDMALLDKEMDILYQQSKAFQLEYAQVENIDDLNVDVRIIEESIEESRREAEAESRILAEEDGYDYYGIEDMEISAEDLNQKPYLLGHLNFTPNELEWLLAGQDEAEENSDTDIISDPESSSDLSNIIESPSPVVRRPAYGRMFVMESDSDAEADYSDDEDSDLNKNYSPLLRN